MNYIDLLKLADSFDKQQNFRLADRIFKVVKAQVDDFNLDEDPLGISNIQPSGMKDDPAIVNLRNMVTSGQISEKQFWLMLEKIKPGSFQNMLSSVGKAGDYDIDKIQSNISSQGIKVAPKERDILAQFYELSNDVFVDFIDSLQTNFASVLRTMSRRDQLPERFQEIEGHRAGNLIMELIEPSTKEEFLTREYLELKAKGISIQDAIEMSTGGEFSDVDEYLKAFVMKQVPTITSQASRITGLRYQEDDVARKISDVTINTLNELIDNSLTELYYIYKG
jgi:hypothetical protein